MWIQTPETFLCKCLFYPLYHKSLFAGDFYWVWVPIFWLWTGNFISKRPFGHQNCPYFFLFIEFNCQGQDQSSCIYLSPFVMWLVAPDSSILYILILDHYVFQRRTIFLFLLSGVCLLQRKIILTCYGKPFSTEGIFPMNVNFLSFPSIS